MCLKIEDDVRNRFLIEVSFVLSMIYLQMK